VLQFQQQQVEQQGVVPQFMQLLVPMEQQLVQHLQGLRQQMQLLHH
jgi:hypothetical protein